MVAKWIGLFCAIGGGILVANPALAQGSSVELSREALKECQKGRIATEREVRVGYFEQGKKLAKEAIQLDQQNPKAHFALFCNLGERMRVDGESLSAVLDYGHLMDALDKALDLDPDYLDAISAKGMILIRLPWIMGGDADKGEVLLKRVIKEEPTAINARIGLARLYVERGDHSKALRYAEKAHQLAQERQQLDLLPEAKELLDGIRATMASR
jgi:tetratricopeptide (TPR) repeat protein